MRTGLFAIALALLLTATGCGGNAAGSKYGQDKSAAGRDIDLPVPFIPDSIADPAARADYLALRYWDAMDFRNPAQALDSAFVEQNFANYVTVLRLATESGRSAAVNRVLNMARDASPEAYRFFADVALRYLYDPESPMYDEFCYLPFAEYAVRISHGRDDAAMYRRDNILKNRPGTMAPDFGYVTPDGHRRRLRQPDDVASGKPERILLMFYAPDCDRCHEAIEKMKADKGLAEAIAGGELRLVAIYMGDDEAEWRRQAGTLPAGWEIGIDADGVIDNKDLYIIRATPTFYLLKPDLTVIQKDFRIY